VGSGVVLSCEQLEGEDQYVSGDVEGMIDDEVGTARLVTI